jgi:hypothetical protein
VRQKNGLEQSENRGQSQMYYMFDKGFFFFFFRIIIIISKYDMKVKEVLNFFFAIKDWRKLFDNINKGI